MEQERGEVNSTWHVKSSLNHSSITSFMTLGELLNLFETSFSHHKLREIPKD